MDHEECRGVAVSLYAVALGILIALMLWSTQDEMSPMDLGKLYAYTSSGMMLLTAAVMIIRIRARYISAVVVALLAFMSTVELSRNVDVLLQLIVVGGLLVAFHALLQPLPHSVFRGTLFIGLFSISVTLIYLGLSDRAVANEAIARGLWYGSLFLGFSILFYGLYVQGYDRVIQEADDRFERSARG